MAFLLLFSGFVFVFGFISLITICLGVDLFVCPSWGSVSSLDIKILFPQIQGDFGHNFFNFFLPLHSPSPLLLSFWESYYMYIGMLHVVNRSLGSVNFSSYFFALFFKFGNFLQSIYNFTDYVFCFLISSVDLT